MSTRASIRETGDPRRPRTALVIGGGIAGRVVAAALQKAGIEPVGYEAARSTRHKGAVMTAVSSSPTVTSSAA